MRDNHILYICDFFSRHCKKIKIQSLDIDLEQYADLKKRSRTIQEKRSYHNRDLFAGKKEAEYQKKNSCLSGEVDRKEKNNATTS